MAYLYNIVFNEKGLPELIEEEKLDIPHDDHCDEITKYLAFRKNMARLEMEVGYVAAFREDKFLGLYNCGKGTYGQTFMNLKEIFIFLLLIGANIFITYHNHPSNILDASVDDMLIDLSIKDTSVKLELNFMDNMIIGKSGAYSLRNKEVTTWDEMENEEE